MHCSRCGAPNAPTSQFCSNCGNSLSSSPAPATSAGAIPPPYASTPQTSGKAIASLICGIINIFPLFIVAIILGHLALSDIKKSAGRIGGRGVAIAGLVLGYLGVVFIPIILIIAAIAIPNLLRARISVNESKAETLMQNLVEAEMSYKNANPSIGFTCDFADLRSFGVAGDELLRGERKGYEFRLQRCERETQDGPITKFQLVAFPVKYSVTGMTAFCADEQGTIRRAGSAENCLSSGPTSE